VGFVILVLGGREEEEEEKEGRRRGGGFSSVGLLYVLPIAHGSIGKGRRGCVEGGENGGNRVAAVGKYIVDFVREKKNGEPRWGSSDVLEK
jgi:hypothetical protein